MYDMRDCAISETVMAILIQDDVLIIELHLFPFSNGCRIMH